MDAGLYKKLCEKIEFVATDAASSELLSVKMMQQGKKMDGVELKNNIKNEKTMNNKINK